MAQFANGHVVHPRGVAPAAQPCACAERRRLAKDRAGDTPSRCDSSDIEARWGGAAKWSLLRGCGGQHRGWCRRRQRLQTRTEQVRTRRRGRIALERSVSSACGHKATRAIAAVGVARCWRRVRTRCARRPCACCVAHRDERTAGRRVRHVRRKMYTCWEFGRASGKVGACSVIRSDEMH